jgi:carboxyl-terminal processing protease
VGIGVVTTRSPSGFILIGTVYPDSPAQAAGLQAGDMIVKVDDLDVTEANFQAAVEGLNGEPGSGVAVVLRRAGLESVLTITRRRVDVPTVFQRLIGAVGYIRISEFADMTPSQFDRALAELSANGALGFVLDVRNNPGGTIESAALILDGFLPEGPIVSATYRDGTTKVLHSSDELFLDVPLVVLQNAKSASAAELFAQALKDYGRSTSVGVITKGKGTMQSIFSMTDGSALDLTVAFYNPPISSNFEGVGVKPDFEVRLTTDQVENFENLDESSDPQLKKALEVMEAKLRDIYGTLPGQPDVVVVEPPAPPLLEIEPDEELPVGDEEDVVSIGPLQTP